MPCMQIGLAMVQMVGMASSTLGDAIPWRRERDFDHCSILLPLDSWVAIDALLQLHLATNSGHAEAVSVLLAAGASIRIRDYNSQTAVQLALSHQVSMPSLWRQFPCTGPSGSFIVNYYCMMRNPELAAGSGGHSSMDWHALMAPPTSDVDLLMTDKCR